MGFLSVLGRVAVLFAALVMVGGLVASPASAGGTDTYCNDCTIGNTPAESYFAKFTSNHSSTFQKKAQQIYYYNYGTQECNNYSYAQVFGLNITCTTIWDYTTARCHLLNDGTVLAICWADFTGGIPASPTIGDAPISPMAPAAIVSPFTGIAVAGHSRTSADTLDAAAAANLQREDASGRTPQIGQHQLGASRRIAWLPLGAVYVVPTAMNRLCVVVGDVAESCGDPLSHSSPVTFDVVDRDGAGSEGPIAFGVTRDGVTAVSFTVAGRPVTVKSHGNFFAFRGRPTDTSDAFSTPTVTFVDGTTTLAK
jgi:hypothetical protein